MTFRRGACFAIAVSVALSGCARSLRHDPPILLYSQLLETNGGLRCTSPSELAQQQARDDRIWERRQRIRPWLEAQIGAAEIERIEIDYTAMIEGVSFTRCATAPYTQWQNMTARRILREMERRQRAETRLRPPPGPRTADTAH